LSTTWDLIGNIDRLGPYKLIKPIGRGGMGTVFLAEDTNLHRQVAVKTLLPKLARDPIAKERFLREGQLASLIKSSYVVVVHSVGEESGIPYLAMEHLRGFSLEHLLLQKGVTLTTLQVINIGRQIAKGLSAAHEKGMVHRDIKPANIWLEITEDASGTKRYRVKILDFGMARLQEQTNGLTRAGDIIGTPLYMSPERTVSGFKVDGRADIFSLGVVLYRLCTGVLPFSGQSTASLFQAMAKERPVPVIKKNPETPEALSKLIDRMVEKKPSNRPGTAKEVAESLDLIELKLRQQLTPDDEETQLQTQQERTRFWLTCSLIGNVVLITVLVLIVLFSV